jgi:cation transport ATPase
MPFLTTAATASLVFASSAAVTGRWGRRRPFIRQLAPVRKHRQHFALPARLSPISQDQRRGYLQLLATDPNSVDIRAMEVWLNHNLKVSGVSVSLAVAGTLFFPPLVLLSLPGLVYGTIPIYGAAYRTIVQERRTGVDALYAFTHTFVIANHLFVFGNLGNLWFFLSRKLQIMARERFRQKLHDVFAEIPTTVYVLVDGVEVAHPLTDVRVGDIVIVHPSETIPVDGAIVEGTASIDEQVLTGEFQPVEKTVGDLVFASTLVHAGLLRIRIQESGHSTIVGQIGQILDNIVEHRTTKQFTAEQLTDRAVAPAVALGALSLPFLGLRGATAIINAHP